MFLRERLRSFWGGHFVRPKLPIAAAAFCFLEPVVPAPADQTHLIGRGISVSELMLIDPIGCGFTRREVERRRLVIDV